ALELDEAADGQPVEGIEGLALGAQDLGAGREADPELEDANARQPSDHEMAELMDDHQGSEDEDEQDDRDDRLEEPGQLAAPNRAPANSARTLRSMSTRPS